VGLDWCHHESFLIASEIPHETKSRLLRAERKSENEKLGQLKIKLLATANSKKSARAA
jgi:hypothetical protein